MLRRELDATGVGVWVTFVAPEFIHAVACVVGDFNGWNPHASPFVEGSGERTVRIHLPAGRYRFRYLTGDGGWFDEPDADAWEPNEFGGTNSLLVVTCAPVDEFGPSEPPAEPERHLDVAGELAFLVQLPAARLTPSGSARSPHGGSSAHRTPTRRLPFARCPSGVPWISPEGRPGHRQRIARGPGERRPTGG